MIPRRCHSQPVRVDAPVKATDVAQDTRGASSAQRGRFMNSVVPKDCVRYTELYNQPVPFFAKDCDSLSGRYINAPVRFEYQGGSITKMFACVLSLGCHCSSAVFEELDRTRSCRPIKFAGESTLPCYPPAARCTSHQLKKAESKPFYPLCLHFQRLRRRGQVLRQPNSVSESWKMSISHAARSFYEVLSCSFCTTIAFMAMRDCKAW